MLQFLSKSESRDNQMLELTQFEKQIYQFSLIFFF